MPSHRRAVGTSDITADAAMQCDFISTADVGIQFSNGNDDTDFEKLLIELTHLNKPRHHARQAAPIKTYMRSERLPKFMRNVSPVIVGLLRELASDKTTEYGFSPSDIASALDDPFARARSWRRLPDFGISTKQPQPQPASAARDASSAKHQLGQFQASYSPSLTRRCFSHCCKGNIIW